VRAGSSVQLLQGIVIFIQPTSHLSSHHIVVRFANVTQGLCYPRRSFPGGGGGRDEQTGCTYEARAS
jgi:hypothetical protein